MSKSVTKKEIRDKTIALEMEKFLDDSIVQDAVQRILRAGDKTISIKTYKTIRELIGIEDVAVGGFSTRRGLDVDLGLKAAMVRCVFILGATETDMLAIFKVSKRSLDLLIDGKVSNIALAVRNYFLTRTIGLRDLKNIIHKELGIKVESKKNIVYTYKELKTLTNVFISRLRISPSQTKKIFHADIFNEGKIINTLNEKFLGSNGTIRFSG